MPAPRSGPHPLLHALRRYRRTISWLLGAVLLALSGRLLLQSPEPLQKLASLPLGMWLLLLPLAFANFVLVAWRMSLSVGHAGGAKVPARSWFRIMLLGQFLNLFVPQLGNLYRGVTLKREFSVTYTAYATGLFMFVWLDTAFGFVLCLLVLLALQPGLRLGGVPVVPAIAFIVTLLLLAPLVASRLLSRLQLGPGRLADLQTRVNTLLVTASRALRSPSFLWRFLLTSVLVMTDQAIILWICFSAVGLPIDPETAVLFQVIVKLSNQVIVTPGNLGVTELAFGVLGAAAHGGSVGYGIAAALVFRVLFSTCVIVLGILLGGIGLLRSKPEPDPDVERDQSAT